MNVSMKSTRKAMNPLIDAVGASDPAGLRRICERNETCRSWEKKSSTVIEMLAYRGHAIVGAISIGHGRYGHYVRWVYVMPQDRQSGVAKEMLSHVLLAPDVETMQCTSHETETAVHHLCRACGMKLGSVLFNDDDRRGKNREFVFRLSRPYASA